ncbi:MAG: class I SAM-dependent methyltransferase [Bacteroidetes bacterium]|nr:class I SAM-dependent methyltransferase [Bacteroidota bacterium]
MTASNYSIPVISFYDLHAAEYNSHMSASDNRVRSTVWQCFNEYVPMGKVLDFGGGTGLDLLWLSERYEKVFFLEPSVNMRAEAHKVALSCSNVYFVENNIDFNDWSYDNLPFYGKLNGVMADFAVFNCIKNIDILFEKLALVCANNSYVIALVLDASLKKLFKNYSLKFVLRSILNQQIEMANNEKGISHTTYLHALKQYASAAKKCFELINYMPVADSNFAILIFQKK